MIKCLTLSAKCSILRSNIEHGCATLNKLILFFLLVLLPILIFANPFYVGGDVGYSSINTPVYTTHSEVYSLDESSGGTGEAAFLGYVVNPYLALEAGYTKYASSTVTENNSSSNTYTAKSDDLLVKVSTPEIENVSLYSKLGLAYANETEGAKYRPEASLGVEASVYEGIHVSLFMRGFKGSGNVYSSMIAGLELTEEL